MTIRWSMVATLLTITAAMPALAQLPDAGVFDRPLLLDDTSTGPILDPARIRPDGETFVDRSTNTVFPRALTIQTRSGNPVHLTATGSGVRRKLMFKAYTAALYVDALVPLGTVPVNTIASSDLTRRIVMVFHRDVDGDKLKDGMREGFEKVWKGKPGPELANDLDRFFDWMTGGVREGDTIELTYIPGEGLYTSVAGAAHPAITRPDIAHGVWQIWLGEKPISEDLKRGLMRLVGDIHR